VKSIAPVAAILLWLGMPGTAGAVAVGQVDDFQDGTTENWFAGGLGLGQVPPVPLYVATTGGPSGAGDQFLIVTSQGGSGPGSRLVAINGTQWAGNYLLSGVEAIGMDLRNLGSSNLTIRLQINDAIGGNFPTNEVVTTLGVVLPAGDIWTHAVFPLALNGLTTIYGDASLALSQATFLRVLYSPTPAEAVPIAGVLGVDNINTVPVPEPSSIVLAITGLIALGVARRRREHPRPESSDD
jgi:hypothetical protein